MRLRTMPEIAEMGSGHPGALHDRKTSLASVRGRASCRLERHGHHVDLVIADDDQVYTDGVSTLDIWRYLNYRMRRVGDSRDMPDEASILSWYRHIYRGYWGFASVQYELPPAPLSSQAFLRPRQPIFRRNAVSPAMERLNELR